jgi:hypothetical protein
VGVWRERRRVEIVAQSGARQPFSPGKGGPLTDGIGRHVAIQWPRLLVMANCRQTKLEALPVSRERNGPTGMPASQKPLGRISHQHGWGGLVSCVIDEQSVLVNAAAGLWHEWKPRTARPTSGALRGMRCRATPRTRAAAPPRPPPPHKSRLRGARARSSRASWRASRGTPPRRRRRGRGTSARSLVRTDDDKQVAVVAVMITRYHVYVSPSLQVCCRVNGPVGSFAASLDAKDSSCSPPRVPSPKQKQRTRRRRKHAP